MAFKSSNQSKMTAVGTIEDAQKHNKTWVGCEYNGRQFVHFTALEGSAEEKVRDLRAWWEAFVPRWQRRMMQTVLGKRPIVKIGKLSVVRPSGHTFSILSVLRKQTTSESMESQSYPREKHFLSLEKDEFLSRGFSNPALLVDEPWLLEGDPAFSVGEMARGVVVFRKVLVVSWEVDKQYLAYPVFASLAMSAVIAILTGVWTGSASTGAQLCGTLSELLGVILCYVVWSVDR